MFKSNLVQQYSQLMVDVQKMADNFPWEDRIAYAAWLAQSYYFVKHSTRLLALAAGQADLSSEILHRRMANHLKEEAGHEKLALFDLKSLNVDISTIPELVSTKLFYQSQYYWIYRHSSAAFLGYILFLEGLAATQGPKILKIATAAHGPMSIRFLKVHAEEDQTHIRQAFDTLDGLSSTDLQAISENMVNSASTYQRILEAAAAQVNRSILEPASI